jgi:hypothetical protein
MMVVRANALKLVTLVAAALAVMAIQLSDRVIAATPQNAKSPLGINLGQLGYSSAEQPFLNIFKTTGVSHASPSGWFTHTASTWDTGEETYLQLDASGYPTTLSASSSDPHSPQLFTSVGVLLLRNLPNSNAGTGLPYRQGKYVVLYDGQGTLSYGFDATLVSSSPGRDVINVAKPSWGGGIDLRITATDPNHTGNYIRNIRVVKAEEEPLLDAGYIFRPGFLSVLHSFSVLRAIQWLNVDGNGGLLANWSARPELTDAGWSSENGAPLEVVLQLCNAVGADCWLNAPHQATNDYITQMATLAHSMLNPSRKVYVEFSNEVWNSGYAQSAYATAQGQSLWSTANVTPFEYNRSWYGMRVAQMCDIWKSVWGADASRVVCVLAAQAANTWTATQALSCPLWTGAGNAPCSNHNINAVAIAPYFGGNVPSAWTSQKDGGLTYLFNAMTTSNDPSVPAGGWLGQVSGWEASYKSALAAYNLPLIAYEGGQTFVGFPQNQNGSPIANLYIAANRDPRMGAAYTTALDTWKANGGETYVVFADIYPPNQYGEWGLLESFLDSVFPLSGAPPKWRAVQNFISNNSCWWANCTGTAPSTVAVPMAPTDLQSQ